MLQLTPYYPVSSLLFVKWLLMKGEKQKEISNFLRAQERPATLIYTVPSGLRITRARHDYNRDAETGS